MMGVLWLRRRSRLPAPLEVAPLEMLPSAPLRMDDANRDARLTKCEVAQ
jgi:hypothetical protein